jgi:hypothetical protein
MALRSHNHTHVLLRGSVRFHRPGAEVIAPSDPDEPCAVTAKVRRKAQLPEPDPAKPISKADLVSKYGADPKDLDAVEKAMAV